MPHRRRRKHGTRCFVEALQKKPYTEYLLDILLSGSMEERACVVAEYGKEVRKIEQANIRVYRQPPGRPP